MIVVPVSNSVGEFEPFYVRVVRESRDVPGSYPFTVCVRDSGGNVVLSRSFVYDFTRDIETYAVDVSALAEGVYRVHIYNWNNCNPPSGIPTFVYWLHKISDDTQLLFEGWDYSRMYVLLMYVYDGKLFWKYMISRSDTAIPPGVPVYIEATDASRNAFVGSVRGSGTIYVRPNTRIPFMAVFKIRYENRITTDVMRAFTGLIGMMKDTYVNIVDDYTVEIGIIKTEPGVPWAAIAVIAFALVAGYGIWAWHDERIRTIELEHRILDEIKPLKEKLERTVDMYLSMLSGCSPGDLNCVAQVNNVMYPPLQTLSSNIGLLLSRGFSLTRCDGLNLGGVCVPWWIIGMAVFLGGLLVISVVRR